MLGVSFGQLLPLSCGRRNKRLHDEEFVEPDGQTVANNSGICYSISMEMDKNVNFSDRIQINVAWQILTWGWFVLNTDGAARQDQWKAGCGGVLRNDEGLWIEGFTKYLAIQQHIWLNCGVFMAIRRGIAKLELRTDSQTIAHNLQGRSDGSVMDWMVLKSIRRLLQSHWEVKIINIYREANRRADKLASMGSEGSNSLVYYEFSPSEVGQIDSDDSRGASFPHLVSTTL